MNAKILDGKQLAAMMLSALKANITQAVVEFAIKPKLVIVQVLGDEASSIYVKRKLITAAEVGIEAEHLIFPQDVNTNELLQCLAKLNEDTSIHGVLLQLPLPPHLVAEKFLSCIAPEKDVDGLTPVNLGYLMQKQPRLLPCTPTGIIRLLKHYQIPLLGKDAVILNASTLVGRPLAMELLAEGATVTLCNSKTRHLQQHVRRAEILISATGKAHAVSSDWLSPHVVVVDVGVHRHPTLGLIGDVEFSTAAQIASWITPVPGGVGPMTVAVLMENVFQAHQQMLRR